MFRSIRYYIERERETERERERAREREREREIIPAFVMSKMYRQSSKQDFMILFYVQPKRLDFKKNSCSLKIKIHFPYSMQYLFHRVSHA